MSCLALSALPCHPVLLYSTVSYTYSSLRYAAAISATRYTFGTPKKAEHRRLSMAAEQSIYSGSKQIEHTQHRRAWVRVSTGVARAIPPQLPIYRWKHHSTVRLPGSEVSWRFSAHLRISIHPELHNNADTTLSATPQFSLLSLPR